jgi:hypothetical protein
MDAEIRTFDDYLTATAELLVLADLEIICVENLQTSVLVANTCATNAAPSSQALFFRKFCSPVPVL